MFLAYISRRNIFHESFCERIIFDFVLIQNCLSYINIYQHIAMNSTPIYPRWHFLNVVKFHDTWSDVYKSYEEKNQAFPKDNNLAISYKIYVYPHLVKSIDLRYLNDQNRCNAFKDLFDDRFVNLEELYLHLNTNIDNINMLPKLKILHLGANNSIADFSNQKDLLELYLGNRNKKIDLKQFPKLIKLDVGDCHIMEPGDILPLKTLECLIMRNAFATSINAIKKYRKETPSYQGCYQTPFINDKAVLNLSSLDKLKQIDREDLIIQGLVLCNI